MGSEARETCHCSMIRSDRRLGPCDRGRVRSLPSGLRLDDRLAPHCRESSLALAQLSAGDPVSRSGGRPTLAVQDRMLARARRTWREQAVFHRWRRQQMTGIPVPSGAVSGGRISVLRLACRDRLVIPGVAVQSRIDSVPGSEDPVVPFRTAAP